jgi:hypothetical protein
MRLYSTSFVYDRFPTYFVQLGSQVYPGGSVRIRVNDDWTQFSDAERP